ncbi:uncharacterized protein LOC115452620 isoform X2 [Manduca sexta]|uniref:uncharacterized protein LOC115452620 isoform X2 n=1 Tax=Manduca sexta TaxID=7130 RepID=UPI001183A1C7|nr:uncharacterized protein LOC115452620 isoform X2 [Manduca sexta]
MVSQTVGDYVCQASNSADHVATWLVIIQAYQTEDVETDNPHILQQLRIEDLKDAEDKTWIIGSGPVRTLAGIVGKQGTVFTTELGKLFETWCLAYGDPPPEVAWYRIKSNDMELVTMRNLLHLDISSQTVGDYVCQASNSANHVATWLVIIQTYQTDDVETDNPHILPRLRFHYLRDLESNAQCTDNPYFANCHLIVRGDFCYHKYYSKLCCKSCLNMGQFSAFENHRRPSPSHDMIEHKNSYITPSVSPR